MRELLLSNGRTALVDDDEYERLSSYRWHWSDGYAYRTQRKRPRTVYLHREVMRATLGQQIDHVNGLRSDCRRENLRFCTYSLNNANKRGQPGRFKGIWREGTERWRACIEVDGKKFYLGRHDTPEQAARAYDEAARRFFGSFAKTNFEEVA